MGGQIMTGASGEEALLIREMTVHGEPLDSRLFSNRGDAGVCWSKRFMQVHGGLDNALPRLILLLCAPFEVISSCHSSLENEMFDADRRPFFVRSPALVVFSIQRCSMNVNERTLPGTLAVAVRAEGSGALRVRSARGAYAVLVKDKFHETNVYNDLDMRENLRYTSPIQ